jgi:lipase ATG15
MLIQGLRVLLPLGEMWTPILDELINMMSFFQSGSIEQVSFYKVTTKFALEIKSDSSFDDVQLTGHSLG